MDKLVSIITATYNSSEFIIDTYQSLYNQNYTNWEWLITDDSSTDNTYDILLMLKSKDPRIKVDRLEKNSGAAVARNNSLLIAKGHFIAFIDSDDLWSPEKLADQIFFMESNCINFSFTTYQLINEFGEKLNKFVDVESSPVLSYQGLLKKNATVGCSTVVLRKSAFEDIEMPLLRTGQDYALWLKLLRYKENAYCLRKVLSFYRIRSNSISRNKFRKAMRQWEIYRNIERLNFIRSSIYFFFYAFHATFRK